MSWESPPPIREQLAWNVERVKELEAENERLRDALQRIIDHGTTHEEPCWAIHNGDCAEKMQEIARATAEGRT